MAEVWATFFGDPATIGAANAAVLPVLTGARFGDALIDAAWTMEAVPVVDKTSLRDVTMDPVVTVPGVDIGALTLPAPALADGTARALLQSLPAARTDTPTPQPADVPMAADTVSARSVRSPQRGALTARTMGALKALLPERPATPAADVIGQSAPRASTVSALDGKVIGRLNPRIDTPPHKIATDVPDAAMARVFADGAAGPADDATPLVPGMTTAAAVVVHGDAPAANPPIGVDQLLPFQNDAPAMGLSPQPMAAAPQAAMTSPIVEHDRRSDEQSGAQTRSMSALARPPIARADTTIPAPKVFPAINEGGLAEIREDNPVAELARAADGSSLDIKIRAAAEPPPGPKSAVAVTPASTTPEVIPEVIPEANARPKDVHVAVPDVRARRTALPGREQGSGEERGALAPGAARDLAHDTPSMRIIEQGASAPEPILTQIEMKRVKLSEPRAMPTEMNTGKTSAQDGLEPAAMRADRGRQPPSDPLHPRRDIGTPATPMPAQSETAAAPALGHGTAADKDGQARAVGHMRAAQDSDSASEAPARFAAAEAAPTHQLARALGAMRMVAGGGGHVAFDLHPASLGQVQVRMIRSSAGGDRIEITVGRAETLALLRADAPALHQALDAAGFAPAGRDVAFQLATPDTMPMGNATSNPGQSAMSDGSGRPFGQGERGEGRSGVLPRGGENREDNLPIPPAPLRRRSTGLDITA